MTTTHPALDRFRRATNDMAQLEQRRTELARERAAAIEEMRAAGMTWKEISAATGLTHQRLDVIRRGR
jgi:hypothetical protein